MLFKTLGMADSTDTSQERSNRVITLTDGVFAIALTLIVLEIHLPLPEAIHSEADLWAAILALGPRFFTYAVSFLTITIFWFGQQSQHRLIAAMDRRLATLHLLFLGFVALLPFSTDLLAEFLQYRLAIAVYWLNMLSLGMSLLWSWTYAERNGLLKPEADATVRRAVRRRILLGSDVVGDRRAAVSRPSGAQRRGDLRDPARLCGRAQLGMDTSVDRLRADHLAQTRHRHRRSGTCRTGGGAGAASRWASRPDFREI